METLHPFETEELAAHLCGLNYDEIDVDTSIIENALSEKYGVELEGFHQLISDLLPMIDVGRSPLTERAYKGFSREGIWMAKTEVKKSKQA